MLLYTTYGWMEIGRAVSLLCVILYEWIYCVFRDITMNPDTSNGKRDKHDHHTLVIGSHNSI